MSKRKISWNVYLIALVFTLFIFLSGLFIGRAVTNSRADSLEISQKAFSALFDLATLKEGKYNDTYYCNLSWNDVWDEKVAMGSILARLENQLGKDNPKVVDLKRLYHDVQVKTLYLVEKSNLECDYNWDIVVFFYSNNKSDNYVLSEVQGSVLDTIYNSNKDSLKVFSFDIHLDTELTKDLKNKYAVNSSPSLILNGKLYPGFLSKNEIKRILRE